MYVQLGIFLCAIVLVGCDSPSANTHTNPGNQEESEKPISDARPLESQETESLQDTEHLVDPFRTKVTHTRQEVEGTGVKEAILIATMNENPLQDKRFHHKFVFSHKVDGVSLFTDTHSSLYLMTLGPRDDLTLITLGMPIKDFLSEEADGHIPRKNAAAFGRCVQRLGLAVDPSWAEELYNWMNNSMGLALLSEDGAILTRKTLGAKFHVVKFSEDVSAVNFLIGLPE